MGRYWVVEETQAEGEQQPTALPHCSACGISPSLAPLSPCSAGLDIDLIEMRSLKPLDIASIRDSLSRTHKVAPTATACHLGFVLSVTAHDCP